MLWHDSDNHGKKKGAKEQENGPQFYLNQFPCIDRSDPSQGSKIKAANWWLKQYCGCQIENFVTKNFLHSAEVGQQNNIN